MKYFAYGSNMNEERMKERGVQFSKREHAVLEGWKLKFNKIASDKVTGYANIEIDASSNIEGILYTISDKGIKKLDIFEGYPTHYNRISVSVKLDNGKEAEAIVYVAQPDKIKEGLKPTKEYLNHLIKGSGILSLKYSEMLKKIKTID